MGEYLENKCNQNYMGVDFSLRLVNFKAYGHVFQVFGGWVVYKKSCNLASGCWQVMIEF